MTGVVTTPRERLIADACAGLWNRPPRLPARWFYDETGSRLFDEITRLPEYYPSRTETAVLEQRSADIAAITGADTLIELGSGTSTKTQLLISALLEQGPALRFVPMDVSSEVLFEAASTLARKYPRIVVEPVVADFGEPFDVLPGVPGRRLLIFLGGTIGNFEPDERADFLGRVHDALDPGDHLLLGADLRKDPLRLVRAYDDAAGVTAAFNRNLITVLSRELEADGLDPEDFAHVARWNPAESRIEMRLRARRRVEAHFAVLQRTWRFEPGEEFLTEISVKFDLEQLRELLEASGFAIRAQWTDPAADFSVTLLRRG
jgi:L-histidine N-alpha-methyltransferase